MSWEKNLKKPPPKKAAKKLSQIIPVHFQKVPDLRKWLEDKTVDYDCTANEIILAIMQDAFVKDTTEKPSREF